MGKSDGLNNALQKRIGASQDGYDPIDSAYDAMFGLGKSSDDGKKIVKLDIASIHPHPSDPFKPYTEDKLKELAGSISRLGLLDPINVRRDKNGGYEVLTGKNRTNAVRLNGGKEIDAFVSDVDDDTAIMIITDSNLKHRDKLMPSEKAFAYKLQLEAVKRQGERSDLAKNETSDQIEPKLNASYFVAQHNDVNRNEVQRHIRLTYLIPELLEAVDNEEIRFMAGVDLSYLYKAIQQDVYRFFFVEKEGQLDLKASALIKKTFFDNKIPINTETLAKLLNKAQNKRVKPFSINRSRFKDYTDKLPGDRELEKLFLEFLRERFGA